MKTEQEILEQYCAEQGMNPDGEFKAIDVRIMMLRAILNYLDKKLEEFKTENNIKS